MDDSQFFYLIHFHSFQVDADTKYHAAARTRLLPHENKPQGWPQHSGGLIKQHNSPGSEPRHSKGVH